MRQHLAVRGVEVASPRETFRVAAVGGVIGDFAIWSDFQQKRSLTIHVYEHENLDAVVAIFDQFSIELEKLIKRLKEEK
jgi:hypothetical protein